MRILIVDDDEELAGLLSELLTREGLRVDMQHDGVKGLATALGGGFDLMILDVMLPGMDGFEILRRVRLDDLMAYKQQIDAKRAPRNHSRVRDQRPLRETNQNMKIDEFPHIFDTSGCRTPNARTMAPTARPGRCESSSIICRRRGTLAAARPCSCR